MMVSEHDFADIEQLNTLLCRARSLQQLFYQLFVFVRAHLHFECLAITLAAPLAEQTEFAFPEAAGAAFDDHLAERTLASGHACSCRHSAQ